LAIRPVAIAGSAPWKRIWKRYSCAPGRSPSSTCRRSPAGRRSPGGPCSPGRRAARPSLAGQSKPGHHRYPQSDVDPGQRPLAQRDVQLAQRRLHERQWLLHRGGHPLLQCMEGYSDGPAAGFHRLRQRRGSRSLRGGRPHLVSMKKGRVSSGGSCFWVRVLARVGDVEQRSCLYGLLGGRIRRNRMLRSRAHVQKGGQAARRKAAPLGANCWL
jgi:hypothetical protein